MRSSLTKNVSSQNVSIQMDAKLVSRFEEFVRYSLIRSGLLPAAASQPLRLASDAARVRLDAQAAARLSELLRDALVAAGAVSDAESTAITQFTQPIR